MGNKNRTVEVTKKSNVIYFPIRNNFRSFISKNTLNNLGVYKGDLIIYTIAFDKSRLKPDSLVIWEDEDSFWLRTASQKPNTDTNPVIQGLVVEIRKSKQNILNEPDNQVVSRFVDHYASCTLQQQQALIMQLVGQSSN